jgi:hypothetical protein
MAQDVEINGNTSSESPMQRRRRELEGKLASMRVEVDPEAEEVRRLEEDLAFEEAKKRSAKSVRLGRVLLEPGQVIFRQFSGPEVTSIEAAAKKGDAAAELQTRIVLRNCIVAPALPTYDEWKIEYPLIDGEVFAAIQQHNSAVRRERAGK